MAVRGVARNLGLVGDFGERIDGFFGCGVKCTYDLGFDLDSGCVASFMRWPLVIFFAVKDKRGALPAWRWKVRTIAQWSVALVSGMPAGMIN